MDSTKLNKICGDLQSAIDLVENETMGKEDYRQISTLLDNLKRDRHLAYLLNNPIFKKLRGLEKL